MLYLQWADGAQYDLFEQKVPRHGILILLLRHLLLVQLLA
jgi:hypothetical protein